MELDCAEVKVEEHPIETEQYLCKPNIKVEIAVCNNSVRSIEETAISVESYCNNMFAAQSNLTKHGRVHTKEVLFHCSQCNKDFTKKWNFFLYI